MAALYRCLVWRPTGKAITHVLSRSVWLATREWWLQPLFGRWEQVKGEDFGCSNYHQHPPQLLVPVTYRTRMLECIQRMAVESSFQQRIKNSDYWWFPRCYRWRIADCLTHIFMAWSCFLHLLKIFAILPAINDHFSVYCYIDGKHCSSSKKNIRQPINSSFNSQSITRQLHVASQTERDSALVLHPS